MYLFYIDESGNLDSQVEGVRQDGTRFAKDPVYVLLAISLFEHKWHGFETTLNRRKIELLNDVYRATNQRFDLPDAEVKSTLVRLPNQRKKHKFFNFVTNEQLARLTELFYRQFEFNNINLFAVVVDKRKIAKFMDQPKLHRKAYERRCESFERQRDAEKLATKKTRELRGEIKADKPDPAGGRGDTPIKVFIDDYLERRRADALRAGTLERCRDTFDRLVNHFGPGKAISAIETDDVSRFLATQRTVRDGRAGRELSKSSRNSIIGNRRTLFSHAQEWGFVKKSPMDGIRTVVVHQDDRRGWHYFTPKNIPSVIRKTPTLRDKAALAMLYGTGLRFGELYALHPDDVDLDAGYVYVRPREATDDTPPFRIKDHERRSVPAPEFAAELANELKATLPKDHPYLFLSSERCECIRERWQAMKADGDEWQNRFLVNNIVRKLKLYTNRAGITLNGPVTVHCLRKSYGRNGARCMSADVLQAFMGHSDISTTLTYYSKRDGDDDVHARWALDALMKGEPMQDLSLSDAKVTPSDPKRQNRRVG